MEEDTLLGWPPASPSFSLGVHRMWEDVVEDERDDRGGWGGKFGINNEREKDLHNEARCLREELVLEEEEDNEGKGNESQLNPAAGSLSSRSSALVASPSSYFVDMEEIYARGTQMDADRNDKEGWQDESEAEYLEAEDQDQEEDEEMEEKRDSSKGGRGKNEALCAEEGNRGKRKRKRQHKEKEKHTEKEQEDRMTDGSKGNMARKKKCESGEEPQSDRMPNLSCYVTTAQERETLRVAYLHAVQCEEEEEKGSWPSGDFGSGGIQVDPIQQRADLVEWITQLGMPDMLGLSQGTIHLTFLLLDLVNGSFQDRGRIPLAALACLLIAAKHEEEAKNVPTLSQLDYSTGKVFTPEIISRMELIVLNQLGWRLTRSTSITFLENMISRGACRFNSETDRFEGASLRPERIPNMDDSLIGYSRFFCDLCVQDMDLLLERHSIIAMAALVCSRRALKVTPEWSDCFGALSCDLLDQHRVRQQIELIWHTYVTQFDLPT